MSGLDLSDLTPQQVNAAVAIAIATGTLYCFLGYRTLKFVLGLTGFIIAGTVAAVLVGWMSEGHLVVMLIGVVVGGLAGAMALFFLYKTGIFFLGLLGAAVIAHGFLAERPEAWVPLAILGIGVLGGLVALLIERPVIMMATAAIGAWIVLSGVAYFLFGSEWLEEWMKNFRVTEERNAFVTAWAVLALAGALAQFATRKRAPQKTVS